MFEPISMETKPLSELVSEQITKLIIDGELKPGDKLPGEYELASMLRVGRSTLREAIKSLVSQNILEVRRGSGMFICSQTGISKDPLGFKFVENKRKLALDLYEVRLIIDPPIARIAAQKATEEEVLEMQSICDAISDKILANMDYTDLDIRFHSVIASCTRNSVMTKLVPIINSSTPLFIKITPKSYRRRTIKTHQAIVDAIRLKDPDGAAIAARIHLEDNLPNIDALSE